MLRPGALLAIALALAAHMAAPVAAGIPTSKIAPPGKSPPEAHPVLPIVPDANATVAEDPAPEPPPEASESPIANAVDLKVRAIRRAVQGHAEIMHSALRALQETLQAPAEGEPSGATEPPETTPEPPSAPV